MNSRPAGGLVIGIDGGGTRTRAAIVVNDRLRGLGHGGPSNYQAVGTASAGRAVAEAIAEAWRDASMEPSRPDAIFLGMAGVLTDVDRRLVREMTLDHLEPERIDVDHDLRTALHGGADGRPGAVLIAGTGSSAYGRQVDGRSWRSGGWGHLLDDLGSGYWLGLQGLVALTRAVDGRSPETTLTAILLESLGLDDPNLLLHELHNWLARTEIAALAPLVLEAAFAGDAVAGTIVAQGASELALMATTVLARLDLGPSDSSIVGIGGLMSDTRYRELIEAEIVRHASAATLVPPVVSPEVAPALGAALLAIELTGRSAPPVASLLAGTRFADYASDRSDPWS